jgi:L-lactate dehydrogenase complex protein LldG
VISEEEFLGRVSARLGRRTWEEAGRPVWSPEPSLRAALGHGIDLAEKFAAEVERIGGVVHRVRKPSEVAALIRDLLVAEVPQGMVVRWEDPLLSGLGLDEELTAAGYQVVTDGSEDGATLIGRAEQAVAGITGCDAAIAETGSLVLGSHSLGRASGRGRGRVVSLLPPVHVAVVYREQILTNGGELFRTLAASPLPPQVVFVSGPSRSSDIENDQSIGVHGPCRVHVVLVEDGAGAPPSGSVGR